MDSVIRWSKSRIAANAVYLKTICLCLLFVSFGTLTAVNGQVVTGTITGEIRDETGGLIPGVAVTAERVGAATSRTVISTDAGQYSISFLPVGEYTVRAELVGFETQIRRGIVLSVDQRLRVDFVLSVGEISEQVEVVGTTPMVASDSSSIGHVMDNRKVVDLPLSGRNFIDLVTLTAGAIPEVPGQFGQQFGIAGLSPNINGNRSDANNYMIDGVPINDTTWGRTATPPSIDAVQEMKIQSSLTSAEFGYQGGGQINVILKSGRNDFHGSLFYFLRRDELDARNFFATEKPPFEQNQYGGSIGGPIIPDRTFFFFNYDRQTRDRGLTIVSTVPTSSLRAGDFNGLPTIFNPFDVDPATGRKRPFPNNQIPAELISPTARAVLGLVPDPNLPGTNRNLSTSDAQDSEQKQFTIKLDHQLTSSDSLSGHFIYSDLRNQQPQGGEALPGFRSQVSLDARIIGLNWTRTVSPSLINQARFGYTRSIVGNRSGNPNLDFAGQNGIEGSSRDPQTFGVPRFSVTGFTTIGDQPSDLSSLLNEFNFTDDISYSRGRHTLKFGVALGRAQPNTFFAVNPRGSFGFNPVFTADPQSPGSGNAFADFLLGFPETVSIGRGDPQLYGRAWRMAFYVQDDWRVTSKLTLNLGARYEFLTQPVDAFNRLSNLDRTTGNFLVACDDGQTSPKADFEAFPQLTFVCNDEVGLPDALTEQDFNNWAPRIGFAYSAMGDKLVIRGGYGIFYSWPPFSVRIGTPSFNAPFFTQTFARNDLDDPATVNNVATAAGLNLIIGQPFSTDYETAYVQEWTLGLQSQIGRHTMAEAIYVGSKGTKLPAETLPNQARLGEGPISERQDFPFLGTTFIFSGPDAYSTYHALQLKLQQDMWKGVSFVANYTYSKTIDTSGNLLGNAATSQVPQNSFDIPAEKARSFFDITHRFVLSGLFELPFGRGKAMGSGMSRAWDYLVGNWQLSSKIILQGGRPFTARLQSDRSGTGAFQDRPDQIGDPNEFESSPERFFNTEAFVLQPQGRFGTAGRNTIVGPGFATVDLGIFKRFPTFENQHFEFRAEIFNLLNRTSFDLPNRNFESPDFGAIFSAKDARTIQLGFKYIF